MSSSVKTINILGVTGSIGQSAADVILFAPGRFKVQAVTANKRAEALAEAAIRLDARVAVLADESQLEILKAKLAGTGIKALAGEKAMLEAAAMKADLTLAAMAGMAGLAPLMAAIKNSRAVAIANKEPLVAAGPHVIAAGRKHKTQILPVDSEHNAVFQVFDESNRGTIEKIILTASGGPFRSWSRAEMARATPPQALAHPNWSMGRKISIDSATMMNKALEVIEAHYLFDLPPEKIEVLVHPQSVVHALVEYTDGSVLAQMGASDMRTPLAHALAWPGRMETPGQRLDLAKAGGLSFEPPDIIRFPALRLAYECLSRGPQACIALNAANEVAVDGFLTNRLGFLDIVECIEHILGNLQTIDISTIEAVCAYDEKIRSQAEAWINDTATGDRISAL